ncbi:protein of unknown function [Paraburkholderia fungorum]|uniref:Uncharacterized protein n=1 Tax=Paraburkholderia fungorum TaxID=134537 RepID=A0A1H1IYX4_9BURK|nr:FecR/PupR family sigma factor regulator [Paraburkholderia fungorum]SDR42556.1 protein of unknown function [Paraburkholderia fungorum]
MAVQFKTLGATRQHVKVSAGRSVAEVEAAQKEADARVVQLVRQPKSQGGRKPTYSDEDYANTLGWIAKGLSINAACAKPHCVPVKTFMRWRNADPLHEQAFADAQADQTHDKLDDIEERIEARLKAALTEQMRQKYLADLRAHRRWVASKRNPKVYGTQTTAPADNVVTVINGLPVDSRKGGDDGKD